MKTYMTFYRVLALAGVLGRLPRQLGELLRGDEVAPSGLYEYSHASQSCSSQGSRHQADRLLLANNHAAEAQEDGFASVHCTQSWSAV